MLLTRVLIGTMLTAFLSVPSLAASNEPTLRDRRQAACYGDAQRLCADDMPDLEKVTACMKPKNELVSAGCRALWDVKG